jgi:exopolysaccharide biosynthesis WecB/TagA/CpsF family protein
MGKFESDGWDIIFKKLDHFEFREGLYSFVNPYSSLILQKDVKVPSLIDYWLIDGLSLVLLINKAFSKNLTRTSFDDTSLAPLIFNLAKTNNYKIAIIGTKQEYINSAVRNIEDKYSVKIDYYRNGYFDNNFEIETSIEKIIDQNIKIVICGMGTPNQEEFLIRLKLKKWAGYGFTCGGYLHQISNRQNYYPRIFDILNLRWLYRIIDEPKLFKRYFFDYPLFFFKFIKYRKERFK